MQDFLTTIATATEIAIAALVFLPLAYRPVKASQAALQPRKMTQTDDVTPTIDVEPVQVETPAAAEILAWEPLEISPIEQRAIANHQTRAAAKHSEPAAVLTIEVTPVEAPTYSIRQLKEIAATWNRNNPQAKLKGWNQWTKARLIEELQALSLL